MTQQENSEGKLFFRHAQPEDATLIFQWANDETTRANSYDTALISWEKHLSWFSSRLQSPDSLILLFFRQTGGEAVGQVRFEQKGEEAVIGITVAREWRGLGYSPEMLRISTEYYLKLHPGTSILAFIKKDNLASTRAFQKAGFGDLLELEVNGVKSYRLVKHD